MNKDLFGQALWDFYTGNSPEDIITWTSISDKDILPIDYLFRQYANMPKIEQLALKRCSGKVLDVGCGAGSHSLWLQKKGIDVKAIDISKKAIEVCQLQGVINAESKSLLAEKGSYDTILLLMNGTGIFEDISKVSAYLKHLKSLLNSNGQILIDSSDIIYMFQDNDQGLWLDLTQDYYGNLDYYLSYKGEEELPMKWLYLDFNTLSKACQLAGLHCQKLADGNHFDYLARITA